MFNDIKAYLYVFAKNLGYNLLENDNNLNQIAQQIDNRIKIELKSCIFEQEMHCACKKCRMLYEERGKITNKLYKYCINSGEVTNNIPPNCPKLGQRNNVFDNYKDTVTDVIINIRKRGK
jgi:hypothetical protein